jgi:hypothetical protein
MQVLNNGGHDYLFGLLESHSICSLWWGFLPRIQQAFEKTIDHYDHHPEIMVTVEEDVQLKHKIQGPP